MEFRTQSGSYYELDEEQKRFRRICGDRPGTPRHGTDGEWRPYQDFLVKVGMPAMVTFSDDTYPSGKTIVTSNVKWMLS